MNNKKIVHMLIIFSAMFMSLIVYLTVTDLYYRDEYTSSSLNSRNAAGEANIVRGTVYDRNGVTLAQSNQEDQKRIYPYKNLYSHVIGYCSSTYGKSLIESVYNDELIGSSGFLSVANIKSKLSGEKTHGNDLKLTIDHRLQQKADSLMGSYAGAIVAMDPQTGEILAMVSKPDFNPDEDALGYSWNDLTNSDSSPFLTRSTMGLYPPGSTFKVITASAMIKNGLEGKTVEDNSGSLEIGNKTVSNAQKAHYGHTDLELGFKKSSNVYFASAALDMTDKMLRDTAESFMFNKKISIKFPYSQSRFTTGSMTGGERAITGIGQGKTLSTPLQLALAACAVANDGKMMKPYIVSEILSSGYGIEYAKPQVMKKSLEPEEAQKIKDLMHIAVKEGTGASAQIGGIDVCGKTGTAENEKTLEDSGKTHAVFIGFAPYDSPRIAVSVILEYAGSSGGAIAAPIARDLMKYFFELYK